MGAGGLAGASAFFASSLGASEQEDESRKCKCNNRDKTDLITKHALLLMSPCATRGVNLTFDEGATYLSANLTFVPKSRVKKPRPQGELSAPNPAVEDDPVPRRFTPVRWAAICTGLIILAAAAYFVTHEQWKLFSSAGFVTFYDEQGRSLLQGKWDVPPSSLGAEAFVVDGKSYGYFGIAPVLPRVILNYLWPSHFGQWSRLSMLIGMASLIAAFFHSAVYWTLPFCLSL